MTREEAVVYVQGQIMCAQAEILGMAADNQMARCTQSHPPWQYEDFAMIIDKYGIHHNGIIGTFQGALP